MKKAIVMLACVLAIGTTIAQENTITIKGTVSDKKTKEPIAYATVYSENRLHYTTTNTDGDYVLKLPVSMKDSRVVFSQMGYNRDTLNVNTLLKKGNVRLTAGGVKLQVVTVSEFKNAKTLMKEVIRRIPENYHTDTMVCTGYFRSAATVGDSLCLFVEHVSDLLRVGYGKNPKQNYANTRGINSNYSTVRKMRLMCYDTTYLRNLTKSDISTGLVIDYKEGYSFRDKVEIYKSYLNVDKNDSMSQYVDDDGISYYVVHSGSTTYTIEKSSLAIVRIERHTSLGNPIVMPAVYIVPNCKKLTPLRKFAIATDEVYDYAKVGDRYTLVSFHIKSVHRYINETEGMWNGVAPELLVHEDQTFQLIGQQPGHWSFLRENGINPKYATYKPYSQIKVSDEGYSPDFWEQFNYIPVEEYLLNKLNAKRNK